MKTVKCTLCRKPVIEGKQQYKLISDEFRTYVNLVHKSCWREYYWWMKIHTDKMWLVYANQQDPMIDYHKVHYQVDIPDFFYDDEFTRARTYPDVPNMRSHRQMISMLAVDEYPQLYDDRMYDNQDYNHPGSHGPNVDWYDELGTARIEGENYEESAY